MKSKRKAIVVYAITRDELELAFEAWEKDRRGGNSMAWDNLYGASPKKVGKELAAGLLSYLCPEG